MTHKVFGNIEELRKVVATINGDIHKRSVTMLVDLIEKHVIDESDYSELPDKLKLQMQINHIDNEQACSDGEEEAILQDISETLRDIYANKA